MTGVVAIFDRRSPVVATDVAGMVAAMQHRGADGSAVWVDGHVGLGTVLLRTLPEDPQRAVVHCSADGRFHAVMDGRIDNRTEISRSAGQGSRSMPDVAIVVEHLRRAGTDGLEDLVGDFALLLWDDVEKRLVAVVDAMAGRPLYVCHAGDRVAIASEPRQLLALRWVPRTVDLWHVAELLTGDPRSLENTVYEHIRRLPPGTELVAGLNRSVRRRVFWRVGLEPDRRPFGVIVDDLRERLDEAVQCRLRSVGPVATELSGGLDSSTVTTIAARLSRRHGRGSVAAYTNSYTSGSADERVFAQMAADHAQVGLCSLDEAEDVLDATSQAVSSLDLPPPPDTHDTLKLIDRAVRDGSRVILTGQGGDQILGGSSAAALDAIVHADLRAAWQLCRNYAWGRRPLSLGRGIYWGLARPLNDWVVPASERRRLERQQFPWLTRQFIDASGFSSCGRFQEPDRRYRRPSDRQRIEAVSSGAAVRQWDAMERVYAQGLIDCRHPFMDRRVVDLAVRIPPRFTAAGDDWRPVHREIARGLLPEPIRTRRDKAEFSQTGQRYLDQLGGASFFLDCRPAANGMVDAAEVLWRYREYASSKEFPPHAPMLLAIANVHHWQVALEHS